MIDVMMVDVLIAERRRLADRINRDGWKSASPATGPSLGARLAQAVLARAGRLRLPIRAADRTAALPANRGLS